MSKYQFVKIYNIKTCIQQKFIHSSISTHAIIYENLLRLAFVLIPLAVKIGHFLWEYRLALSCSLFEFEGKGLTDDNL